MYYVPLTVAASCFGEVAYNSPGMSTELLARCYTARRPHCGLSDGACASMLVRLGFRSVFPFLAKTLNVRLRIDTFPDFFPQPTQLQDASLTGVLWSGARPIVSRCFHDQMLSPYHRAAPYSLKGDDQATERQRFLAIGCSAHKTEAVRPHEPPFEQSFGNIKQAASGVLAGLARL